GDHQPPSGHVHGVGRGGAGDGRVDAVTAGGGHGDRAGAGAAGAGLAGPALVDPQRHVTGAAVDHELDVHAVRVGGGGADGGRGQQVAGVGQVVHEGHRVRVAHVHVPRGPAAGADAHGDLAVGEQGAAHADGDVAVLGEVHALHSAAGGDREVPLGHIPGALEVAREDPHAVAAHLGDRAVTVAVVHEPFGVGRHGARLGVRRGPHDVQQPVAAEARAAVAQGGYGGRGQIDGVLGVRDDHEVVLGAVPLEEGGPRAHSSIVRG